MKFLLPAGYVAEHVELGYAGTVFSAQGRTVATAHALVGVGMTREALYVAATRAREANRLYVDVEPEPAGAEMAHGQAERLSAREVLVAVASRRGADISAHQTMAAEWAKAVGFDQLVKEHQSLVAAAMAQRWESALQGAGFSGDMLAKLVSPPSGPACSVLSATRRTGGLDVGSALPELAKLPVSPTEDAAAMLRARLRRWEKLTGGNWQPRQDLVAGLVPRASRIDDPDLARAVGEREDAIAKRALDLAEHAVRSGAAWAKPFGPPPPPGRRPGLVGPPRRRRRLPGPLAYHHPERPRRAERHRLALPSRPPRPGATGRTGSCSLGRGGAADVSPGTGRRERRSPKPGSSCEPAGDGRSGARSWPRPVRTRGSWRPRYSPSGRTTRKLQS